MTESPADALIRLRILTVTDDGRLVPTGDVSAVVRHGAAPRPVSDVSPRRARTGVPPDRGAPYRMAHPMMAHPIRPEPLPASRRSIAPDLLAIAVIVLVVLAASLAGVRV